MNFAPGAFAGYGEGEWRGSRRPKVGWQRAPIHYTEVPRQLVRSTAIAAVAVCRLDLTGQRPPLANPSCSRGVRGRAGTAFGRPTGWRPLSCCVSAPFPPMAPGASFVQVSTVSMRCTLRNTRRCTCQAGAGRRGYVHTPRRTVPRYPPRAYPPLPRSLNAVIARLPSVHAGQRGSSQPRAPPPHPQYGGRYGDQGTYRSPAHSYARLLRQLCTHIPLPACIAVKYSLAELHLCRSFYLSVSVLASQGCFLPYRSRRTSSFLPI